MADLVGTFNSADAAITKASSILTLVQAKSVPTGVQARAGALYQGKFLMAANNAGTWYTWTNYSADGAGKPAGAGSATNTIQSKSFVIA